MIYRWMRWFIDGIKERAHNKNAESKKLFKNPNKLCCNLESTSGAPQKSSEEENGALQRI